MKNKLTDANNHLFMQLERLNDEQLRGDALKEELARSRGVANITKQIIANARLALDAEQFRHDTMRSNGKLPAMLENDS